MLTGSHGGESSPELDIPRYIKLYNNQQLMLNEFITQRFKLEEINTAIEDMRNGKIAGRCMIQISE